MAYARDIEEANVAGAGWEGAGVMVTVRNAEIIMSKWLGMWVRFIK